MGREQEDYCDIEIAGLIIQGISTISRVYEIALNKGIGTNLTI